MEKQIPDVALKRFRIRATLEMFFHFSDFFPVFLTYILIISTLCHISYVD